MRNISGLFILVIAALFCGCTTNTLYMGTATLPASDGNLHTTMISWTSSEAPFREPKAGPIQIASECSERTIFFDQQGEGILFRGMPGSDLKDGHSVGQNEECGHIETTQPLTNLGPGTIELQIDCSPRTSVMTTKPNYYLAARSEPYRFSIREIVRVSSLGGTQLNQPLLACGEVGVQP